MIHCVRCYIKSEQLVCVTCSTSASLDDSVQLEVTRHRTVGFSVRKLTIFTLLHVSLIIVQLKLELLLSQLQMLRRCFVKKSLQSENTLGDIIPHSNTKISMIDIQVAFALLICRLLGPIPSVWSRMFGLAPIRTLSTGRQLQRTDKSLPGGRKYSCKGRHCKYDCICSTTT